MASNNHAPRNLAGLSLRLRELAIHTGDLKHSCLGCGYEHDCGIHGCAVLLAAEDAVVELERQRKTVDALLQELSFMRQAEEGHDE